jgi:hypothetical protein
MQFKTEKNNTEQNTLGGLLICSKLYLTLFSKFMKNNVQLRATFDCNSVVKGLACNLFSIPR